MINRYLNWKQMSQNSSACEWAWVYTKWLECVVKMVCSTQLQLGKVITLHAPLQWEPQVNLVELKPVNLVSDEWIRISQLLTASLPVARLTHLHRIQKQWLWDRYAISLLHMKANNCVVVNEMELFHGTRRTTWESIPKWTWIWLRICCSSIRSVGHWGLFAVNASYSHKYAYCGMEGEKQLLLAKVLTGLTSHCEVDSSLTKLPNKPLMCFHTFADERYDTVCGHLCGSKVCCLRSWEILSLIPWYIQNLMWICTSIVSFVRVSYLKSSEMSLTNNVDPNLLVPIPMHLWAALSWGGGTIDECIGEVKFSITFF